MNSLFNFSRSCTLSHTVRRKMYVSEIKPLLMVLFTRKIFLCFYLNTSYDTGFPSSCTDLEWCRGGGGDFLDLHMKFVIIGATHSFEILILLRGPY